MELPVESPNKYGKWNDDSDEFAVLLGGKPAARRAAVPATETAQSEGGAVDEDFLRSLVNDSESKYGR